MSARSSGHMAGVAYNEKLILALILCISIDEALVRGCDQAGGAALQEGNELQKCFLYTHVPSHRVAAAWCSINVASHCSLYWKS